MNEGRREVTLRFLAQPTDVNFGGNVHGGTMMKWIDEAGYACATGWCKSYSVTVHVGDVGFYHPVKVGSIVELHAKIIHTGRTSMHVAVGIQTGNLRTEERTEAIHCVLIFVAVDESGTPLPVPTWTPKSEEDRNLESYAVKLLEMRRKLHAELGTLSFGQSS